MPPRNLVVALLTLNLTALATSSTVSHLLGMNVKSLSCVLLFFVSLTQAHESHSHEPASDDAAPGQYAQRHVRVSFTCVIPF
jgi:hypothetical protein